MNSLNLFEVIETLASNKKLEAYKETPHGTCYIRWSERDVPHHMSNQQELCFFNAYGHKNIHLLTDDMIDQQNHPVWKIQKASSN